MPTPTELKTYINADVDSLGLPALSNLLCSRELNRLGAVSGHEVVRELVNTADIITALYSNKDEFMALSEINLRRLNLLSPIGVIDPTAIQNVLLEIFDEPTYPTIRAALIALAIRPASPAEKEWGRGTVIRSDDVEIARRDG